MTQAEQLAAFVQMARYQELSDAARDQIKVRILDAIGCAIGAVEGDPMRAIRAEIAEFGGTPRCSLIGNKKSSPDRAALYNSALVRYLDFNDSYLAKGESCHPSDNLGAVLAAAEYADRSGKELMTSLAVAYQVQCRLSDVAPVRSKGFDHTVQGSYALAAGISKALGLGQEQTTNAIAICGTAFNALRVTRTGSLSNWKGLAYPNDAFCCVHATFLASHGITGPRAVFEGNKGFMEAISGLFQIDWLREDLERVTRTILKRYNAEVHSQSTLEAVLELRGEAGFSADQVDRIEVETFDVAYNIIGGGEEGEKTAIHTKEEADHSLPYMVAVAILDGQVMPAQYRPDRIRARDVQALLRKVSIRPSEELSRRFPNEMPSRVTVHLQDGRHLTKEKRDYEGFITRPMRWESVVHKFKQLAAPYTNPGLQRDIAAAVADLETTRIPDLMKMLRQVRIPGVSAARQAA